jgi:hypothetical protein
MSDIRGMVQTALDTALKGAVYAYWQRKSGPDADEYIVYTLAGDSVEAFADDAPLVKSAGITVRYYYRAEKLDTHAGRQAVKIWEESIQAALEGAGFTIPFGAFDAGDVDDIGYFVTVFECEYQRVV